jgi:hypothetical protein
MGPPQNIISILLDLMLFFFAPVPPSAALIPGPPPPLKTPGALSAGLAWDGTKFWASDFVLGKIYRQNDAGDGWKKWLDWPGNPGPLAWQDGVGLWVVDEGAKELVLLTTDSATPLRTTVPIPPAALREFHAITGLAWDGRTLWLATGCGLCSSFFRVHPSTGKVLQSIFPNCEPRGLAFLPGESPSAGTLWTVAYSGPKKSALLSSRNVAIRQGVVSSAQTLFAFSVDDEIVPPQDPIAILTRTDEIWVVDRDSGRISRYEPRSLSP